MAHQSENALTDASARRPVGPPSLSSSVSPIVVRLAWGLGDVLLATSAIRRFKELHPLTPVIFQTYTHNRSSRYRVEYPNGCPAEMLYHNPDIERVVDTFDPLPPQAGKIVDLRYAAFGGPSLDYPIQAHYWENLGLEWETGQRFDAHYYVQKDEVARARSLIGGIQPATRRLAISPAGGWAGKLWSNDRWTEVISWALGRRITPIILAGKRLSGPPWDQYGVMNLSGQTDIRQAAAVLDIADIAVMIEGGMSNLRFALGRHTVLLTCATQSGLQVWTPPELTTEIRMVQTGEDVYPIAGHLLKPNSKVLACEPCMWRREMVTSRSRDVFPATIRNCPTGRSLRDVPAPIVIAALEEGPSDGSEVEMP